MGEEKEKRKAGERRSAQRIKRVLADTTPKHLEQLTKQARALAGNDEEEEEEGEGEDPSMDAVRRKLGHLRKRHALLREKLTDPSPPQKSLVARMQEEFEKGIEGKRLEGEDWNDSVIKELQERLHSSDAAAGNVDDDEEANGQLQIGDREGGDEDMTILVNQKVIRGMKGGRIVVRFDTAFGDKSFESYYCVLKSNENLHVVEHSIPFFLPVRELEKDYRDSSPKLFIDHMGDVLQAYVSRREQVNELKRLKGDVIGELYHSLSYTLIELTVEEPQCQVGLSLAYHNPDLELPTQCTITAWPLSSDLMTKKPGTVVLKNSTAFRLPKGEAFLRTLPLPRGFVEFLTDLRDTLGLSPPPRITEAPQLVSEAAQPEVEAAEPAMEAPQPLPNEGQPKENEAQPVEVEAVVEDCVPRTMWANLKRDGAFGPKKVPGRVRTALTYKSYVDKEEEGRIDEKEASSPYIKVYGDSGTESVEDVGVSIGEEAKRDRQASVQGDEDEPEIISSPKQGASVEIKTRPKPSPSHEEEDKAHSSNSHARSQRLDSHPTDHNSSHNGDVRIPKGFMEDLLERELQTYRQHHEQEQNPAQEQETHHDDEELRWRRSDGVSGDEKEFRLEEEAEDKATTADLTAKTEGNKLLWLCMFTTVAYIIGCSLNISNPLHP